MSTESPDVGQARKKTKVSLREQQLAMTRDRIVGALGELIETKHPLDITMAAVAAHAEVSEPTLYRHFPSKRDLFSALGSELYKKSIDGIAPTSLDELVKFLPALYEFMIANDAIVRWNLAAPKDEAVRPSTEERLPILKQALAKELHGLSEREATFLLRGIMLLTSSLGALYWQDNLELEVEEAAETAAWLARRIARTEP